MITIAALLTVFNRKQKTLLCLERLYSQELSSDVDVKVFLVDDGCTDGTADAVKAQYSKVNIIQGDGNLFWNRGMCLAWETAAKTTDFDFYLWLNDDTFTYPNMIASLLSTSKGVDDKAIIVGSTQDLGRKYVTYGGRQNGVLLTPNRALQKCTDINGNILLVPRYVFKKIGGMDKTFLHAGGDTEYGWRAVKNGIDVLVAPEYLGECDLHEKIDTCFNPSVALKKRWKAMYAPTGIRPPEFFYLERKYKGLGMACFHYITTHLHCILPQIWMKEMKSNIKQ